MNTNWLISIGVIGGAIALALIGVALWMTRRERDAGDKAPPPPGESPQAPAFEPSTENPAALPTDPGGRHGDPPGPTPPADETVEILRVLRHQKHGDLMVEIGGRRYGRVNDIKESRTGLDLIDTIAALQKFVGPEVFAPLAAAQRPEPIQPPAAPEPLQLPSMNPFKQMLILRDRELKKSRERAQSPPPSSIVEEIEALLVKRLVGSPFEGRSIHMRPGLHGGAHIDVDGQGYASVEDVADPEVKQFLKTVIADWEKDAVSRK